MKFFTTPSLINTVHVTFLNMNINQSCSGGTAFKSFTREEKKSEHIDSQS